MRTEAEILEAVADGYESGRYEWIQGQYENDEGFCAMGALQYEYRMTAEVHYDQDKWREASQSLESAVHHINALVGASVPQWNDMYGRTKDEVIDVFKHAAKNARNQETP